MQIELYTRWVKAVFADGHALRNTTEFKNDRDLISTELKKIEPQIDKLTEYLKVRNATLHGSYDREEREAIQSFHRRVLTWRKMAKVGDEDSYVPGTLKELEAALVKIIGELKHKWLFVEQDDEELCPMFVSGIHFITANRYSPAHVNMEIKATKRGDEVKDTISFYYEAMTPAPTGARESEIEDGDDDDFEMQDEEDEKPKGKKEKKKDKPVKTVVQILSDRGLYLESDDLVQQYMEEIKAYRELTPRTGLQMLAKGIGEIIPQDDEDKGYSWWYSAESDLPMVRDGKMTRVVLDNEAGEKTSGESFRKSRRYSWESKGKKSDGTTSSAFWKTGTIVALPLLPYLQVFDLEKHKWVSLHVVNLEPYPWDKTMGEKLILPPEASDLVSMLLSGVGEVMDDIVRGKTGGIIVISTGQPGTGKTLTAEVYSEVLEKPLYVVQCSQLGTNESMLEKKLATILSRAQRWGAILLMDEADVYIRERGKEIQQNAIVGVFLRLLEYYKGVLFMTSNKTMEIDDAILSRATAWLRYELPNADDLEKIWGVLSTQFKLALSAKLVGELLEAFPPGSISGRNVKNLLKLAIWRNKKIGGAMDTATFKWVSQFQDIDNTLIEEMSSASTNGLPKESRKANKK